MIYFLANMTYNLATFDRREGIWMNTWSKEVFAKNLNIYMNQFDLNQKQIAEIAGVSPPTVNDWIKARKYPRIDKIDILADHFGVLKSDLTEDKAKLDEIHKKSDTLVDVTKRMMTDEKFTSVVASLVRLNEEQLDGVKNMLDAFLK